MVRHQNLPCKVDLGVQHCHREQESFIFFTVNINSTTLPIEYLELFRFVLWETNKQKIRLQNILPFNRLSRLRVQAFNMQPGKSWAQQQLTAAPDHSAGACRTVQQIGSHKHTMHVAGWRFAARFGSVRLCWSKECDSNKQQRSQLVSLFQIINIPFSQFIWEAEAQTTREMTTL